MIKKTIERRSNVNKVDYQRYKPAKSIAELLHYLNEHKHVQYNEMDKKIAGDKLLEYNYINVITPFKHKFAKLDDYKEVIKINGKHIYDKNVEFKEYFDLFLNERKAYPIIIKNIIDFEMHFKSISAYHIFHSYSIHDSTELELFLERLKLRFSFLESRYNSKRITHMNNHLNNLIKSISRYANIYCFFDRMSLGNILTIYTCLDEQIQNIIIADLKRFNMNFNLDKVPDFINKIFCLVSIRNCVMHCNSLEILIRFYNPKTQELRTKSDRKKYLKLIKVLSIEKTHEIS